MKSVADEEGENEEDEKDFWSFYCLTCCCNNEVEEERGGEVIMDVGREVNVNYCGRMSNSRKR